MGVRSYSGRTLHGALLLYVLETEGQRLPHQRPHSRNKPEAGADSPHTALPRWRLGAKARESEPGGAGSRRSPDSSGPPRAVTYTGVPRQGGSEAITTDRPAAAWAAELAVCLGRKHVISPSSPGSLTTGLGDGSSWSLPGRAMRTVPGRPEGQRRGRASAGGPQQPSVPRRPRAGAWTLVGLGATHGRPDTGAGCSMDAAARKDRAGKGARRALGDGVERHTATRGRAARAASSTPLCPVSPARSPFRLPA